MSAGAALGSRQTCRHVTKRKASDESLVQTGNPAAPGMLSYYVTHFVRNCMKRQAGCILLDFPFL